MKLKKIILSFFTLMACLLGMINVHAESTCKYSDAKICEHKLTTINLINYYIEYGYTNNNSSYFGIATSSDYSDLNALVLPMMTNSGSIKVGNYTFQINKDSNLIFLPDYKLVEPSMVIVSIDTSYTGNPNPFLVSIFGVSKCAYPQAIVCEKKMVNLGALNYHLEYGYDPTYNKPYLLVSSDLNFKSYNYYVLPLMYVRGEMNVATKDGMYNFIIPEVPADKTSLIFLSGNKLVNPDMIGSVSAGRNVYLIVNQDDELPDNVVTGDDDKENASNGEPVCESLLGKPSEKGTPAYYIVFSFDVMKYVAIIILVVWTVIDFSSAIPSQDSDIIKKTAQKALKRLIICIIIFVLPTLISFLLGIVDKIPNDMCGIK